MQRLRSDAGPQIDRLRQRFLDLRTLGRLRLRGLIQACQRIGDGVEALLRVRMRGPIEELAQLVGLGAIEAIPIQSALLVEVSPMAERFPIVQNVEEARCQGIEIIRGARGVPSLPRWGRVEYRPECGWGVADLWSRSRSRSRTKSPPETIRFLGLTSPWIRPLRWSTSSASQAAAKPPDSEIRGRRFLQVLGEQAEIRR